MEITENLDQLLGKIDEIPSLSGVVSQINSMLKDPRTSADELGEVISMDQALAAKVLKLVNSSFYGFPGKIKTLPHAIALLGFSSIRNIVLTASIIGAFSTKNKQEGLNLKDFWLHSIAVGALAKTISKTLKLSNPDEYFLSGLLHDMGKLVLQLHLTPEYLEVFVHIKESPMHILNAEEAVLGVSHSDVGAWLARHWKLPQDIINSIEYHHKPSLSLNPISPSVIQLSDILARGLEIGSGGDPFIPPCDAFVWEALSLSEVSIEEILKHSSSEIENAAVFMSIL